MSIDTRLLNASVLAIPCGMSSYVSPFDVLRMLSDKKKPELQTQCSTLSDSAFELVCGGQVWHDVMSGASGVTEKVLGLQLVQAEDPADA